MRAGNGFARVYRGETAAAAVAVAVASVMAILVTAIHQRRKFHPSFPIASVGQTSMARCAASFSSGVLGCLKK
jgi:hypothetical protein